MLKILDLVEHQKIKTIILDDEIRGVKMIEHLLAAFPEIEIVGALTSPEEAIEVIHKTHSQLLILDIQMPKYNGFEVLEKINMPDLKFIFVTAHNEYAIKAFKYSAIDYLLKPIDEESFATSIKMAIEQIRKKDILSDIKTLMHNVSSVKNPSKLKLCISSVHGFTIIKSEDIIYCEADSCYTIFKLSDGKQIISSKTLSEYEAILDDHHFIRIHRSYIINISFIAEYRKGNGGYVVMTNGKELEVSRRKKEEFLQKIKVIFSG